MSSNSSTSNLFKNRRASSSSSSNISAISLLFTNYISIKETYIICNASKKLLNIILNDYIHVEINEKSY